MTNEQKQNFEKLLNQFDYDFEHIFVDATYEVCQNIHADNYHNILSLQVTITDNNHNELFSDFVSVFRYAYLIDLAAIAGRLEYTQITN